MTGIYGLIIPLYTFELFHKIKEQRKKNYLKLNHSPSHMCVLKADVVFKNIFQNVIAVLSITIKNKLSSK